MQEEQEYSEFLADILRKGIELTKKYNALSVNNKRKFLLYIEPLVCAYGTQRFISEIDSLFGLRF